MRVMSLIATLTLSIASVAFAADKHDDHTPKHGGIVGALVGGHRRVSRVPKCRI